MRRGIATFTLDYGKCPPWLFERMVSLGRSMIEVMVDEYGPDEFIKRIADPVWFQTLGTVLAFDWNASGLTTVLTGALKEAIRGQEKDLGIFIAGGKGATSRKTPDQITSWGNILSFTPKNTDKLVYSSKMAAKVDSSMIQDGYTLYHHAFFFSKNGAWTVVQQGMNTENSTARRYHWFSDNFESFVEEPHTGIASQAFQKKTLNLVAKSSFKNRDLSVQLAGNSFNSLMKDVEILRRHSSTLSKVIALKSGDEQLALASFPGVEYHHHAVEEEDFTKSRYLEKILEKVTENKPQNYESLLGIKGVGGKTLRALSLVSEVIYGAEPSYLDPARYSFAHGGKDATPYPVDKETYDKTIQIIGAAVRKSKINPIEKDKALKRLSGV